MKGNLKAYLAQTIGGREVSDDEIILLKKEYRRLYLTAYRKAYKKHKRKLTIVLSKAEYETIKENAKNEHLKVSTFVKQQLLSQTSASSFKMQQLKINLLKCVDYVEMSEFEGEAIQAVKVLEYLNHLDSVINDSKND